MAKFIKIPVTSKGETLICTDNLCVNYVSTTSITMASGGRIITLTMDSATVAAAEAISTTALLTTGPIVNTVSFPAGTTCTAIVIS
jgi:hypothetical protein